MFLRKHPAPSQPNGQPPEMRNRTTLRLVWGLKWKQWLYLPRLFTVREKFHLAVFGIVAVLLLMTLGTRLFVRMTVLLPATGGELREGALAEPRFINPIYASTDTDRDITNLVFSKLIQYDRNGAPAMDLAERIEVSRDAKAYTVSLRSGVRWHDGEKFSADDVIFTIKTIQDPEYQSPFRQNWQGVGVEKLNDVTVRFSLRQPYAPFLENLALGIVPEHLWRKIPRESAILSDLNLKPIGTGPYRFEKFSRREDGTITSVALTRNSRYHLARPYLKAIRFSFYPNEEKLIAAYRHNEIDSFVFLSRTSRGELEPLDVELHELKLPKVFAVFLNANASPALGRRSVRQALGIALDREAIVARTLAGGGTLANSAIPSGTFGFNGDIPPLPYDPNAARKLLTDDGWKLNDAEGVLERTEGRGRSRTTQKLAVQLVTSDARELSGAAELIAEMWRAIGVKTEVKVLAINDLEATMIRPRAYQAILFGEVFGHEPDPFAFWHTSQLKDPGLNIALYSNRAVDELLEAARRTHDASVREQKYREFQKIVGDEMGAIFLYSPIHYYAVRKNIAVVVPSFLTLPEERFNEINQWYMDTRRSLK